MLAGKYLIGIFAFLALAASPVFASGGEGHGDGFGKLWLNISNGYYDESDSVWDEETTIYNGTDFRLNLTNKGSKASSNTTLILSLHPGDYSSISYVAVNGHQIMQSEFGYGTPGWNKCEGGFHYFPSHGIFPANYSLYDLGNISAGGSVLVTINISSSISNPRTHYDAAGFAIKNGDLCWDFKTPNSHDAGTGGSSADDDAVTNHTDDDGYGNVTNHTDHDDEYGNVTNHTDHDDEYGNVTNHTDDNTGCGDDDDYGNVTNHTDHDDEYGNVTNHTDDDECEGDDGSNVPFFPGAAVPIIIGLAVPAAAYRLSR